MPTARGGDLVANRILPCLELDRVRELSNFDGLGFLRSLRHDNRIRLTSRIDWISRRFAVWPATTTTTATSAVRLIVRVALGWSIRFSFSVVLVSTALA